MFKMLVAGKNDIAELTTKLINNAIEKKVEIKYFIIYEIANILKSEGVNGMFIFIDDKMYEIFTGIEYYDFIVNYYCSGDEKSFYKKFKKRSIKK